MLGPHVIIATASHPILPALREKGYPFNRPVHIGRCCWLTTGVGPFRTRRAFCLPRCRSRLVCGKPRTQRPTRPQWRPTRPQWRPAQAGDFP